MPTPPPELKRGPKWLREMINSLRTFAIETQPLPGVGVQVNDSPSGRAINARTGGSAAEAAQLLPFQLADASEGGQAKLRVAAGFVGGQMPPGMSNGDNPPYIVGVAGSGRVYVGVTITISDGSISSVFVGVGSTIPPDTTTKFHFPLGSFSVAGSSLNIASNKGGNIAVSVCRKWYISDANKAYSVSFSQ